MMTSILTVLLNSFDYIDRNSKYTAVIVRSTSKMPNKGFHMITKDQLLDFKRIMHRFILSDYFSITLYATHYITIRLWLIRLPLHRADHSSA